MKNQSIVTQLKGTIYRHPMITLTCVLLGLATSAGYIYITPPEYESRAILERPIKTNNQTEISLISPDKSAETEKITSSEFIAKAINNKVNATSYYISQDLRTRYNSYSFPYIISYRVTGDKFSEQSYDIKTSGENNYVLTSNVHGLIRSKTGTFDMEMIDRNLAITIKRKKTTPFLTEELMIPAAFSFKIQSPEAMALELTTKPNGIKVTDNNGVVTIECQHESAAIAADLAKAISEYYLDPGYNNSEESNETSTALDQQIAGLSSQLEATENEIAEYKRQNNITELTIDTEKSLDILKNLQLQKTQLEINKATLDNVSKYLRKNREINNSTVEYGTIGDPVFSEQIALLNEKYESKIKGAGGATADAEIESLKTLISERILNTRKKNAIQLNKVNGAIAAINSQLATLPEKSNILNTLDRKLALDKKVFDLLAEKRAHAMVSGSELLQIGKILKPASKSTEPVSPITWLTLIAGMLSGFLSAFPIGTSVDKWKQRKISGRESMDLQTKIPFIGSITPSAVNTNGAASSISALCTRVLLQPTVKLITFASADKGAGKTFITIHFAQAFAAMDKKVLVIDMNHENPAVAGHFAVTPERSLSDVLEGKCDIHDAISLTSYPNLDILECGNLSSGVNSLLASNKRKAIFEDLQKHYDIIVTDTPDIGTQIDAIPMMKLSDLSLFVVRANTTRKQSLVIAEQIKKDYDLQNVYFLLNSVNPAAATNESTRRSRIRNINKHTGEAKVAYIPHMLRKISLWFY